MVCRADCTCVLSSIFNRTVVKTRVTFRTTSVVHTSYSHDVVSPIFDTSQFLSVFDISTHAIFIYNIVFNCDLLHYIADKYLIAINIRRRSSWGFFYSKDLPTL